jgi:shikimate dehydrogenase
LADAVRGLRAMGFRGGNLTIPHKVAVIEHLDRLSDSARLIGAVNCIVRDGNELVGENTDGKGFLQSLGEVIDPRGKSIVVLGAGGAARAIAVELALAGAAKIIVVNRHADRGRALVEHLQKATPVAAEFVAWQGDYSVGRETDILVNATSVGLFPKVDERLPIDVATLRPGLVVADVIPNPPETRLLKDAQAKGCITLDGLGMLVNQGVIGFRLWTGIDPDPRVMHAALREVFC